MNSILVFLFVFLSAIWCFYRLHPVFYGMAEAYWCIPEERRVARRQSYWKMVIDVPVICFMFWFFGSSFAQL